MAKRRWLGAVCFFMAAQLLMGCFTVTGGIIGAVIPRYEQVQRAPVGASVRVETSSGTVDGVVASANATGFVVREGEALRNIPLEGASIEQETGSYAATGATIGGVIDVCVVAAVVAFVFLGSGMNRGGHL